MSSRTPFISALGFGKRRDFESVVRAELPFLYRVARRMAGESDDAGDLVQSTLIRAHSAWDRFDGRKLRPWLLKILYHENLARFRRSPNLPLPDDETTDLHADDLWTSILNRDQAARIMRNMDRLQDHYRIVVQLCDVEEMSYEEVATALEIPIGTVRSRLFRGRDRLRTLVLADGGEDA